MLHIEIAKTSLLTRVGVLMGAIVLLALIGMGSSVIIAEATQGVATAVNQAGSLRMQSFRIATGLVSAQQTRAYPHAPLDLIDEFETRFTSPRLTDAIPDDSAHQLHRAYAVVAKQWREVIGPLVRGQARGTNAPRGYLQLVDDFVARIDYLVVLLEDDAEKKIESLRLIQGTCLLLTIVVVTFSLVLVQRRLLIPLRELLVCAEQARLGIFSHRTRYVGDDELGHLGKAFNVMAEDLSKIYADLEQRVRKKTEDLAHKNRSLELLYTTSKQVNNIPITEDSLQHVVHDIEKKLKVGSGTICLLDDSDEQTGRRFASTRPSRDSVAEFCWQDGCRACLSQVTELATCHGSNGESLSMMCFPIRDGEQHFGVLLIDLPTATPLESWQRQVLETVAGHIGTAINNHNRTRESRRLALHEERNVIARELHDSLAQSLSYLKIQISRLDLSLKQQAEMTITRAILLELKEGVNSAYRQLRELLTTFRLKMDGRGLNKALTQTVQEFRHRSTVEITLNNRLPPSFLSPNEEIHVLQIVREALSNVVRHAQCEHAWITLDKQANRLDVTVDDDGCGLAQQDQQRQHYGMTIMRERALSLAGRVEITAAPQGGTRIHLIFSKSPAQADAELTHVA
jgi:two-component system nitrate/nitrite sensor histidine kinase NarX